jgi:hypothetical protein
MQLDADIPSGSTQHQLVVQGGKWQPVDVADVLRKDLASSSPGKGLHWLYWKVAKRCSKALQP